MKPFRSIEERHGLEDAETEAESRSVWPRAGAPAGPFELFVALVFPLGGIGFAVWRFNRGDLGPGVADLLVAVVGAVALLVIAGK